MNVFCYYETLKAHQQRHLEALAEGIRACGDIGVANDRWQPADHLAVWGHKDRPPWHDGPMLFLEAGFINGDTGRYETDRLRFCSFGWNGIGGHADRLPPVDGSRWDALGIELKPWREIDTDEQVVLVCLQHPNDRAARGADFDDIIARAELLAADAGMPLVVRQHPVYARRNGIRQASLAVELERAAICITYSSNAAVEAVIAGVATIALDQASVAWPVTAHSIEQPFDDFAAVLEAREQWAHELAFRQWTLAELRSGEAWEFIRQCHVAA